MGFAPPVARGWPPGQAAPRKALTGRQSVRMLWRMSVVPGATRKLRQGRALPLVYSCVTGMRTGLDITAISLVASISIIGQHHSG
jgi:hypothetical protein